MKYLALVIIVSLGLLFVITETAPYEYEDCKPECVVTVQYVIDGDTFVTSSGMRVRLVGVDAPELNAPLGLQAKQCLEALIEGKRVKIKLLDSDKYGRQVAQVLSHRTTCPYRSERP